MAETRKIEELVPIRLLIDGDELTASVPSREVPALIDRWFKAIGAGDVDDQPRIDALARRMKAANDKLQATIQANTPTP
ncbi:MAG TPA: hypothetical protein VFB63_00700 [Bryobacteraceae bacterium]|nr:hypothetical protein [Bryobacteraceae bacterium]